MKKVLLITRSFVPYHETVGGVIRMLKVADYLYNHGFEVHILTGTGYKLDYFGYEEQVKRYIIHYYEDFLQKIANKNQLSHKEQIVPRESKYNVLMVRAKLIGFARDVLSEFFIPHRSILIAKSCFKEAKKIIEEEHIENVLVTSPPPTMAVIGLWLKKHFKNKINLITDYRDSWNLVPQYWKRLPILKGLSKRLEKQVLQLTDHFTYVYEPMLPRLQTMFSLQQLPSKSYLIMNGSTYNKTFFMKQPLSYTSSKIKIGYFGAIAESTNPKNFFDFINQVPLFKEQFEFYLYGINDFKPDDYSFVKLMGSVSRDKAVTIMKQMHLLFISYVDPVTAVEMITGKFFDYIGTGRPILIYGHNYMNAAKIVKRKNLGYVTGILPEDKEQVIKTLHKIIDDYKHKKLVSYTYDDIKEFSLEHQFSQFLKILK